MGGGAQRARGAGRGLSTMGTGAVKDRGAAANGLEFRMRLAETCWESAGRAIARTERTHRMAGREERPAERPPAFEAKEESIRRYGEDG